MLVSDWGEGARAEMEAAFVWKSSGESLITVHDGEECGERLKGDDWAEKRSELGTEMKQRANKRVRDSELETLESGLLGES